MLRFRIPELFLGCFLTVAVFATGMLFINWQQPGSTAQPVKQQEATSQGHKTENPDSELTGSTWLTKDAAGFFTFGLVVVGVGQALLFFIQLRYMRKGMNDATIAAEAAKESADTAKIQAVVARNTLITMQETAERQLRAYVGVSGASISKVETGAPEVIVTFKNFGQTPAYDVQSWIHIWIAEYPLTVVLPEPAADFKKSSGVHYPGSQFIHVISKEPPVREKLIPLLGTKDGTIYVYGRIKYRDAFKQNRTSKFRMIYGGTEPVHGNLLKHDSQGNEAD